MSVHDQLTQDIIGSAIAVHRALGPGLMEATYEEALCIELTEERLRFSRQVRVPIIYRGKPIGEYRPDFVGEDRVVVEIKSVERLMGLLLNFNAETLRSGIKRLAI